MTEEKELKPYRVTVESVKALTVNELASAEEAQRSDDANEADDPFSTARY